VREVFNAAGQLVERITTTTRTSARMEPTNASSDALLTAGLAYIAAAAAAPDPTATRKQRTFAEKRRILRFATTFGRDVAAKKFGIARSSLQLLFKQRQHLDQACARGQGGQYKIMPPTRYAELYEAAYKYVVAARECLHGVSTRMVRLFCIGANAAFAKLDEKSQCECLAVWRRHYGLSIRRVTGKPQILPRDAEVRVKEFAERLTAAKNTHPPARIVVCDETSVIWYAVGKTTIDFRGAKEVKVLSENDKLATTALLGAIVSV